MIAFGPDYLEVNTFRLEVMSITKEASLEGHVNHVKVKQVRRLWGPAVSQIQLQTLEEQIWFRSATNGHVWQDISLKLSSKHF